tara:strand:- start:1483 stop:2529 length:1047 start_codon:yes stop_codon:yes gene_type:complete
MISLNNFGNISYEVCRKKVYKNKIIENTAIINDIYISEYIKQIPFYKHYFAPIENHSNISLQRAKISKETGTFKLLNKKPKYLSIKILDKIDFLFSKNPLLFFEGFLHILSGIVKLTTYNIVHLGITHKNLTLDPDLKVPLITNFNKSIYICDLEHDIDVIFESENNILAQDYINKWKSICKRLFTKKEIYPFELHIINLIINKSTITNDDIDNMIKDYIQNNTYLDYFDDEYREKYIKKCYKIIARYDLNLELVSTLSFHYESWDNFLLSGLYIVFFNNLRKRLKEPLSENRDMGVILNNFLDILSKNISPDFTERFTVLETYHEVSRIIFSSTRENYENLNKILMN